MFSKGRRKIIKNMMLKRLLALAMMLVMVLSFAACGKEPANTDNGTNNNHGTEQCDNNPSVNNSKWSVTINGNNIALPCTLSDLSKKGINIISDYDKDNVLNSINQTHTMISASCGDDSKPIFLKIITGDDTSKKEANAKVYTITNNKMLDGSSFVVKNGLSLGAAVADIISAYGDDYAVDSAPSTDDLTKGFVMMHYGSNDEGMLFWFQDGKLTYVELYVGE